MCIIAYKPAGVAMLEEKIIDACWQINHDGAGFMLKAYGKVQYWKGFMKLSELKEAIKTVIESIPEQDVTPHEMAIHFRIATHGGVKPELTHPFPLSLKPKAMFDLYGANSCVMHNGIITKGPVYKDHSDTSSYILSFLAPLVKTSGIDNPFIESTINGSRMLITTSDQKTVLLGDWKKGASGWKFSNWGYIPKSFSYTNEWDGEYGGYGGYGGYYGRGTYNCGKETTKSGFPIVKENTWYDWDSKTRKYNPSGDFIKNACMEDCFICGSKACYGCKNIGIMAKEATGAKYQWLVTHYGYRTSEFSKEPPRNVNKIIYINPESGNYYTSKESIEGKESTYLEAELIKNDDKLVYLDTKGNKWHVALPKQKLEEPPLTDNKDEIREHILKEIEESSKLSDETSVSEKSPSFEEEMSEMGYVKNVTEDGTIYWSTCPNKEKINLDKDTDTTNSEYEWLFDITRYCQDPNHMLEGRSIYIDSDENMYIYSKDIDKYCMITLDETLDLFTMLPSYEQIANVTSVAVTNERIQKLEE